MTSELYTMPKAIYFIVSDYTPQNRLVFWGVTEKYEEQKSLFDIGVWKIKKLKV